MSAPTFRRHPPQLAVAAGGDGGDGGPRSQQLVMTPQLQQAIRLLQLSRLELIAEIKRELDANPTVEDEST